MVTVSWKKVCLNQKEGGLGTKSLICLNEATNLKQCWNIMQSEENWARILRSIFIRDNRCITHHISSSLWSSIKSEFRTVQENTTWFVGNGENTTAGLLWMRSWTL